MHLRGHTTDWRYGHGVPGHVTTRECSIRAIRRRMHGVTPLTGVTDVESPSTIPKHVFDSGQSTTRGGTPLTGVPGWVLQRVSRQSLGLGRGWAL